MGTAARREPLKQRVNRCLLKLADRDTEAMAAAELEAIARSLGPDELAAFVSAVSDARPTDKTPLRRHALFPTPPPPLVRCAATAACLYAAPAHVLRHRRLAIARAAAAGEEAP